MQKKRNPKINFMQLDARTMEFDCIGAFDVSEHIEEDRLVLEKMYKALKSGGHIILSVPQHKFLWSQFDEIACHKRRYTRTELKKKVIEAGFTVECINSFTSLLFPLMVLSRLLKKRNASASSEFNLSKLANFMLKLVLNFEFFLVKLGFQFPFGGSLLLVAKK